MTDKLLIKRELLERACALWPTDMDDDGTGRAGWLPHVRQTVADLRSALAAPRQPEGEGPDERMKAAGMLSVAELLAGAPLDAFMKHAGVNDMATFADWLEMRRAECVRMHARYDLGERDNGDDLYEWTIAHAAVFNEVHVNFKAAHADAQRAIAELREECERLRGECARLESKYERDVWGLNNEGDPIGGDHPSGFANDLLRVTIERDTLRQQLAERDAEILEQCRLNGMGAECELKLLTQRDKLAGLLREVRGYTDSPHIVGIIDAALADLNT